MSIIAKKSADTEAPNGFQKPYTDAVAGLSPVELQRLRSFIDYKLDRSRHLSPERVIGIVADFHRVTVPVLLGRERDRKTCWALHVAMTLCVEFLPNVSTRSIAAIFNRKHNTISHARRIVLSQQKNPAVRQEIDSLRALLASGHDSLANPLTLLANC